MSSLLRTNKEIELIYNKYVNTIYQICFMYMKNESETEDAVSDTFLKLINYKKSFENQEHEKAWLIVTASNVCKNKLKHWFRRSCCIDDVILKSNSKDDKTLVSLLNLPNKYKEVLYMYYYCGYKSYEIAKILKVKESTIRSTLLRGRNLLKDKLMEEINE